VRSRPDESTMIRHVFPQRIVDYRDHWHLDSWCHMREALRTFALEQIHDAVVAEEKAIEVDEPELDKTLKSAHGIFSDVPDGEALLKFSPARSHSVAKEEWRPKQKGRYLLDG
jgi:proteasome accessory factor C